MTRSRIGLWLFALFVAAWLIAPTLVVIPLSFTDKPSLVFPPSGYSTRWYANFFSDSTWTGALINSLQIGVFVAILSTIIATMAALCVTRVVFPGRTLVSASLLSPIIVPAIIVAIGIYAMFLRLGLMGTFVGFTASHTVLAVPFALIPITASLQSFDRRLEQAASVCGASPLRAFLQVTLPGIMPGMLSGARFAFVTSFDEVVVSLFIQSPYLETSAGEDVLQRHPGDRSDYRRRGDDDPRPDHHSHCPRHLLRLEESPCPLSPPTPPPAQCPAPRSSSST